MNSIDKTISKTISKRLILLSPLENFRNLYLKLFFKKKKEF